jgi:hypothetical protein
MGPLKSEQRDELSLHSWAAAAPPRADGADAAMAGGWAAGPAASPHQQHYQAVPSHYSAAPPPGALFTPYAWAPSGAGVDVGREVQLALDRGGGLDAWAASSAQNGYGDVSWAAKSSDTDEAMFDSLIQEDSFG